MPLRIVIDARRVRDFGIGTYIRSLVHALGKIDSENQYVLIALPEDARTLTGFAPNFETAVYRRPDSGFAQHVLFPMYLRSLHPDLVHIPLNRVPLFMIKPYVVTIHDMASLLFDQRSGLRMNVRRFLFQRGLVNADRVIAVSDATRRDVQQEFGVPGDRVRRVYNAPNPEFFAHRHPADARVAGPDARTLERQRILERYSIHCPFILYAGNIRRQKNVPRLVEAFAVVRASLAEHPVYKDLRLIIIGDEIHRYPVGAARHHQEPGGGLGALHGLRPLRYPAVLLRIGGGVRLSLAVRGLRAAAAGGHGFGDAGGGIKRQLAAGGGGRCRHDGEPGERLRYRARHSRNAARRRPAPVPYPKGARAGGAVQLGAHRTGSAGDL